MSKIGALSNAIRLSRGGLDLKSRAVLFALAMINQLGFHRRRLRGAVAWFLRLCAEGPHGYINFLVKMPLRRMSIAIRADDFADYQSAWECLSGTMYRLPSRPVKHVIDGGANLGLFSAYAAGHLGVPIIAVEPAPNNIPLLLRNVGSIPGVKIINAALSAFDGVATFNVAASNLGHLNEFRSDNRSVESCQVRTTRLESITPPNWAQADMWLKLDIEGAEYDVLRDLFASGLRPAIISAELHDFFGANGAALVADIKNLGYSVLVEGSGDSGNVCRQIHAEFGHVNVS
jgi:FkbM family methyltransferase